MNNFVVPISQRGISLSKVEKSIKPPKADFIAMLQKIAENIYERWEFFFANRNATHFMLPVYINSVILLQEKVKSFYNFVENKNGEYLNLLNNEFKKSYIENPSIRKHLCHKLNVRKKSLDELSSNRITLLFKLIMIQIQRADSLFQHSVRNMTFKKIIKIPYPCFKTFED